MSMEEGAERASQMRKVYDYLVIAASRPSVKWEWISNAYRVEQN